MASRVLRIARLGPASRAHLRALGFARLHAASHASRGSCAASRASRGLLRVAWRVLRARITERVSRGFARFAPPPALCAHLRAWLRAVSHASRGFARFARERFVRLHAPRAGFVRAPAHARLRAGFARALCARGFARFRALRVHGLRARTCARAASRGFARFACFAWLRAGFARAASRGFARFARAGRVPRADHSAARCCDANLRRNFRL